MENIHKNIKRKIITIVNKNQIPHIIFHGESGCGKKILLKFLLDNIYKDVVSEKKKDYILYVNCIFSKGIRYFREELKFFAKTNILSGDNVIFKSIILLNADYLTIDTQSALRRCIEKYSHTTRFFIIVENKEKLLKPILSRFCNIFVPLPNIKGRRMNLYDFQSTQLPKLKKKLVLPKKMNNLVEILELSEQLYKDGFFFDDIFNFLKRKKLYFQLSYFEKIRLEYRNEKLIMFIILYYFFMRPDFTLENI